MVWDAQKFKLVIDKEKDVGLTSSNPLRSWYKNTGIIVV